jgi:hypothetical protein
VPLSFGGTRRRPPRFQNTGCAADLLSSATSRALPANANMILGAKLLKLESPFSNSNPRDSTIAIRCATIPFLARTAIVCKSSIRTI